MELASNNSASLSSDQLDESGFTIIELVISVLLLALTASFLAPMLIQALNVSATNELRVMAIELNREKLEQLQNGTYTCQSLDALVAAQPELVPLASGEILSVDYVSSNNSTCYTSTPYSYPITVTVTSSKQRLLSKASTNLLVQSAN